ncbi:hypothetical protein HYS54_03770 [Candidatus Micrarchaeota archaeon]|nr:hypothetical protein [Candidatus Micrarchaeota archaeon]
MRYSLLVLVAVLALAGCAAAQEPANVTSNNTSDNNTEDSREVSLPFDAELYDLKVLPNYPLRGDVLNVIVTVGPSANNSILPGSATLTLYDVTPEGAKQLDFKKVDFQGRIGNISFVLPWFRNGTFKLRALMTGDWDPANNMMENSFAVETVDYDAGVYASEASLPAVARPGETVTLGFKFYNNGVKELSTAFKAKTTVSGGNAPDAVCHATGPHLQFLSGETCDAAIGWTLPSQLGVYTITPHIQELQYTQLITGPDTNQKNNNFTLSIRVE